MTDTRNNGGPAFPQHDLSGYGIGPKMDGDRYMVDGMSLRDWFAGQVLSGYVANGEALRTLDFSDAQIARYAYDLADAMLATRSSSKEA